MCLSVNFPRDTFMDRKSTQVITSQPFLIWKTGIGVSLNITWLIVLPNRDTLFGDAAYYVGLYIIAQHCLCAGVHITGTL